LYRSLKIFKNSEFDFKIEWSFFECFLFGSLMGIPLSTTHCKVGAVVSVGLTYDKDSLKFDTEKIEKYKNKAFFRFFLNWFQSCSSRFKNILAAWLITVPASAIISAALFWILKAIIPIDILSIAL